MVAMNTAHKKQKYSPIRICPNCFREYTMGIDGTTAGCDRCEGIIRLPNGMIDYSASSPEVFVRKLERPS